VHDDDLSDSRARCAVEDEPVAQNPTWFSTRLITPPFLAVTAVTGLFFVYVGIQIPLIPRLIEDRLGGTELDIGLNLAVFSLSAIAIRPFLGAWGDRYGRRTLMIGGAFLAGIGALVAGYVTSRWMLLPLRAMSGIGEGALFVGAATMISDLAPAHRRAEAASYFSVAVFGGIGIGPILGETLAAGDDFRRGLVVASLCAFGAAALAFIVPKGIGVRDPAASTAPRPGDAVSNRFHRAAIRPGATLAFGMAGFATFNAFMPEHARNVGLSGSKWVFATYSVVCLVVRIVGAKVPERIGLTRAVTTALLFLSSGLAVLSGVASPVGVFLGAALIGIGMSFLYPALMALTVNAVPEHERARVISTFTMFFEVGSASGGLAFGFVANLTSKRGGFLAGAISAMVGLWFLWRVLLPHVRLRPIPASETVVSPAH